MRQACLAGSVPRASDGRQTKVDNFPKGATDTFVVRQTGLPPRVVENNELASKVVDFWPYFAFTFDRQSA